MKFIKEITKGNPKTNLEDLIEFGVDVDSLEKSEIVLRKIIWHGWNETEINLILDKIENIKSEEDKYQYQVYGSDLFISIYKDETYFFDPASEKEEADLIWTTEKFKIFLNDFKAFIEENS